MISNEIKDEKAIQFLRMTSVLRRYEDMWNEVLLMRVQGMEVGKGMEEKELREGMRAIKRAESASEMYRRTKEGEKEVWGTIYSRKITPDGRYQYEVYIQGEGTHRTTSREKHSLYQQHLFHRFIQERRGGLSCHMELIHPPLIHPPLIHPPLIHPMIV